MTSRGARRQAPDKVGDAARSLAERALQPVCLWSVWNVTNSLTQSLRRLSPSRFGIAQVGAATVCVWVGGVKSSSIPSERWSGRRDAGASPPAHPHSNQSGAYRGVAFRSVVPIRDERWLVEVEDALRAVESGLVWRPAAGRLSTDKAWTLVTPRVWTLMTQLVVIPWTLVTHTNS